MTFINFFQGVLSVPLHQRGRTGCFHSLQSAVSDRCSSMTSVLLNISLDACTAPSPASPGQIALPCVMPKATTPGGGPPLLSGHPYIILHFNRLLCIELYRCDLLPMSRISMAYLALSCLAGTTTWRSTTSARAHGTAHVAQGALLRHALSFIRTARPGTVNKLPRARHIQYSDSGSISARLEVRLWDD